MVAKPAMVAVPALVAKPATVAVPALVANPASPAEPTVPVVVLQIASVVSEEVSTEPAAAGAEALETLTVPVASARAFVTVEVPDPPALCAPHVAVFALLAMSTCPVDGAAEWLTLTVPVVSTRALASSARVDVPLLEAAPPNGDWIALPVATTAPASRSSASAPR